MMTIITTNYIKIMIKMGKQNKRDYKKTGCCWERRSYCFRLQFTQL